MKTAQHRAVDWFYRFWVLPIAAIVWFGVAILICLASPVLGIVALLVAAILFEGLLGYRRTEQPSTGNRKQLP